jgi:hypothetical protein
MLPYIMYHKATPWKVLRKVAEHHFHFKNGLEIKAVEMYMKHISADHVLRDPTHFIFVEKIEEAEIIE